MRVGYLFAIWCCAAVTTVAQEIVIASRDNLVPFTDQQLTDLGYKPRTESGRAYWYRPVDAG